MGLEGIQNDFTSENPTEKSVALIGPFPTWRIRESKLKERENAGLNLSGGTAAYRVLEKRHAISKSYLEYVSLQGPGRLLSRDRK
jgi:hypothetical protein